MHAPNSAPKVFVSHASEDKDRFVMPFAEALRQKGIDAWVDKWEMLPGDSLVDKIFEEGLKEAAAVIIVISSASVLKPWVREELNAAVVKRIEKGTKIIPVVLDSAEVPESLRSLIWESIKDLNNFESALDRIVDAIYGHTRKPALGPAPAYIAAPSIGISGLTLADTFVLRALFDAYEAQGPRYVNPYEIVESAKNEGIGEELVAESLEILEHHGYIEQLKTLGRGLNHARIQTYGVSKVLGDEAEDSLIHDVALCLLNDNLKLAMEIGKKLNRSEYLVIHAFDWLEANGHVKAVKSLSGMAQVFHISPTLRRALSA